MTYARSRIYSMGEAQTPPPEVQRRRVSDKKREAWHKHGLLVIDPEDVNDDWVRQMLINTGDKHYGRRVGRG
ncbi:MAG: hypothetical protein AAF633_01160 [Chloroflexota bacterium]